ncbi:MAG: DMT family transporter [Desulfobacterales bacterium]|nr:DMT family transporter [Desulfobacterales bacterium]MBL7171876.1 DMT family transporter [Desulfobacteraceae bacterium]
MTQNTINNRDLPFSAATFTAFLCTLFGANAVAIKISLFGLGVFTTAGLRFGLAAIAIFLWAWATRRPFVIKKGQSKQLLIVSLIFALQLALLYLGFSKTTASRGVLLINTQPFFVLFLAHWFIPEDQITKNKVLGLLLGFSGMALVFLGKKGVTTEVEIGDLMVLITAFLWACNTVYTKRIISEFAPFQIVLYPMVVSVPFFFLAGYIWDVKMITHLDLKVLSSLIYQSLVTASFGFVAWNSMLQKYGAVSLHSFIFIMPIAGVLLGGLVLGEAITWDIILALAFIVSGIVVVNLTTREYTPLYPPRGV